MDVHSVLRCVIRTQRSTECTSVARHSSQHNTTRHAATIPNWYSEINVTFYSVTLARMIWLPDDDPRTETCRSVFNILMCKFYKSYICAVVGIIIEPILANLNLLCVRISRCETCLVCTTKVILLTISVKKLHVLIKIQ